LGLAANLSTAVLSGLGTFLRNRFGIDEMTVINYLNLAGLVAAVIIQYSHYISAIQNLWLLVFATVILRAGYSSFVSLAFL